MPERMWGFRVTPASALLKHKQKLGELNSKEGASSIGVLGDSLQDSGLLGCSYGISSGEIEMEAEGASWEDLPELALVMVVEELVGKKPGALERKVLFAAAGVCKSWRLVALREMVKHMWASKQPFIHPAQLLVTSPQPLSDRLVKCCLHREVLSRGLFSKRYLFTLHLKDPTSEGPGKFLLSAVQHSWQSLSIHFTNSSWGVPCAKLLCNAWGNQYKMQHLHGSYFKGVSSTPGASDEQNSGTIAYRIKWKNLARVRQWDLFMHVHLPPSGSNTSATKLVNNPPRWNQGLKCFSLDFDGRVKLPSVKNFQLLRNKDAREIVMQFGKVASDAFILDFDPEVMSTFQAFSIALASFEAT